MPKVHIGTGALKNVKAQVCSKAHYINRKSLIDFSGLRSRPKLGPEHNSLSPCQGTRTELHSQPRSPRRELQPAQGKAEGSTSERWEKKAKGEGMSRASMWTVETRNVGHTIRVVKVVTVFLKSAVWICTLTSLNFQEGWAAAATLLQMLSFENTSQCCPVFFEEKSVQKGHRKGKRKTCYLVLWGDFWSQGEVKQKWATWCMQAQQQWGLSPDWAEREGNVLGNTCLWGERKVSGIN